VISTAASPSNDTDPSEATDVDDIVHGVKYRAVTPDGAVALGRWQRARAELKAATDNRRRELERRR
jgi:hypothetical protein